jgi:vacuolar protein sorting-associated protein 35
LKLENYPTLITFLSYDNRKRVSVDIAKTCTDYPVPIPTADYANKLLELLLPLIKDDPEQTEAVDDEDFQIEQNLVASLVSLFENENPAQLFAVTRY